MRRLSWIPFVTAIVAATITSKGYSQTPSNDRPVPRACRTAAEREWTNVVPALQKADKQRLAVGNEIFGALQRSAHDLCSSAGRKAFIDEALSLKSKQLMLTNRPQHRAWLRRLYLERVFPLEPFQKQVLLCSNGLAESMQRIDNALLVECFVDVEDFPKVTRPMPLDLAKFNRAVDREIDEILKAVYDATGKELISFTASWIASDVVQDAAKDAMRDENGRTSWLGEIISLGIGAVADEVVTDLTDELLQTRQDLDKHLQESTNDLLENCLTEGTAGQFLQDQMIASIHTQKNRMGHLIIDYLKVDPKWAVQYYNATLHQPSK